MDKGLGGLMLGCLVLAEFVDNVPDGKSTRLTELQVDTGRHKEVRNSKEGDPN